MAIFWDAPANPDDLTVYTRLVPLPNTFTLSQLFPVETTPNNTFDFAEITRTNRTARYRSFDGRVHVSSRDVGKEGRVKLLPLSSSLEQGEFERLQIDFARFGGNNVQLLTTAIYNDAAQLVQEMHARIEQAWGDVLTDGKLTISENGFFGEADFGPPAGFNPAAATAWTNSASSDPLTDIISWCDTYRLLNGFNPAYMLPSLQTTRLLQTSAKVIAAVAGSTLGRTRAKLSEVKDLFDSEGLPTLLDPYDTQVDVDGVSTRVLPANKLIMLPPNVADLGAMKWGISATALELVNSQVSDFSFADAPGIVGVVIKTDSVPFRQFTYVDGVGMPILKNARLLMSPTVF